MAELITTAYLRKLLERLRENADLVIVDSWPWFHEATISLLDVSDLILTVLTLEITNIKNIRLFLEVVDQLGYPPEKVQLVLNRGDTACGIRLEDVENSIGRKVDHTVGSDWRVVVYALNRGVPFVWSDRPAQVSQDVIAIARAVTGVPAEVVEPEVRPLPRKSFFARR